MKRYCIKDGKVAEDECGEYVLFDDIRDIVVKAKQLDALIERANHVLNKRSEENPILN